MPSLPFPFDQNQVWAPRVFDQEGITPDLRERGTGYLNVVGRLKPGVTPDQAGLRAVARGTTRSCSLPGRG